MGTLGRIWFHDNPWPNGHAISEFAWSGRLDEEGRLWFDLHLETVDYASEGPAAADLDDNWHSTVVWCNYHNCTLSSTNWADEGSTGFSAGSPGEPLTWARLTERTLTADVTSDGEAYDFDMHHSFLIYLMGHDGVADHRLSIRPAASIGSYDLEWTGKIALAYTGDHDLSHTFRAEVPSARFDGFVVDDGMSDDDAWELFRNACPDADQFELVKTDDRRRFLPLRVKP
jgi:hypothetical protein